VTEQTHPVTTLTYTAPSGKVIEFDPDWTQWPEGIRQPLQEMPWADRLVLLTLCRDIIHALNVEEA
jgi:hypothetical protein